MKRDWLWLSERFPGRNCKLSRQSWREENGGATNRDVNEASQFTEVARHACFDRVLGRDLRPGMDPKVQRSVRNGLTLLFSPFKV